MVKEEFLDFLQRQDGNLNNGAKRLGAMDTK